MAEQKKRLISKGRYVDGVKCEKLLWYKMNDRSVFPPTDAATQLLFDQGHEVGALAKKLYKDAIEIEWDRDAGKVTEKSAEALKTGKTLFEAGFAADGTYSIADVLDPVKGKKGTYDLTEVKMAGHPKDYYYDDIAFQKFNYEKNGIKINNCYLKIVNTAYVYEGGEIDVKKFFQPDIDVNDEVENRQAEVKRNVKKFHEMIAKSTPPKVKLSENCTDDEHKCPLVDECWKVVPKGSTLTLYRKHWDQRFDLFNKQGKKLILDIPKHELNNDKHEIMHDALRTKEPVINKEEIKSFVKGLNYPLYFLDFETFMNVAVPKFKNSKPYQMLPFQFSLHIQEEEGGKAKPHMFLAPDDKDPRPEILAGLKKLLGDEGDILAFNAHSTEKRIIRETCEAFPEYKKWFAKIEPRIKDLKAPFSGFDYYHHEQEGSASLKDVYPAMTGKSYKDLKISEGGDASAKFIKVTYGKVSEKERAEVRSALEEYCEQDTRAMVEILEKLQKI